MRTDVKVGSVIAIVLVLVGVWFFVVRSKGPDQPAARQEPQAPKPEQRNVVVADRTAPRPPTPQTHPAKPSAPLEPVRVGYASDPSRQTTPPGVAPKPDRPLVARTSDWWPDRAVPSRITPPRTEPQRPAESALTRLLANRPRTYRVKSGDSYWSIAKAQYGDASLYGLVEKANPNIPAKSLRPNMTIKIPPRPEQAPSAAGPSAAALAHGTTRVDVAAGKRYYVVKKGDNGFWGISKAVFKTPRHWQAIARLNPGVDSSALKPGQKIWVPKDTIETALRVDRPEPSPAPSAPAAPLAPLAARVPSGGWSGTGAPARTALADGRIFD